ncbi:NAD(P)/FAD-dependent oxidoreductase [Pseudomarimonas salicorniae]|uniref:FAD-binding oxidoreductase n=1 Tax=Pseudomarimonas salicorniae TaxID=2933270 RepID=A0ABT0GG45_9GAMM|nr:FAD-dependent oxidoreductase [Lysobacter sp. CAU 1642]MCK7593022.1 FAD-binding oxidoreductase [Lysobacter sp. CAU 1642]
MDLKSGYPFWAVRNGLGEPFPGLAGDVRCDLVVVGGGITGAIFADCFTREGLEVVVLDQRDVGWGSTAASTAMLQYEIDTHLIDLARRYGETAAVLAYRACLEAVRKVRARAARLGVDQRESDSLYLASTPRHLAEMQAEFALRRRHRFPVSWLEVDALRDSYGAEAPGAILSRAGAWLDPYQMARALLRSARRRGARVHDRAAVQRISANSRGVRIETRQGAVLRAPRVVIAAGYESQGFLSQRVAKNRSSYALATDHHVVGRHPAIADTLIWESARPYFYLRSSGDGRIIAGGEDDEIDVPARRDARVDAKARRIARRVSQFLPEVQLSPAWAWAGTFAETFDGLPFIGAHPQWGPRVFFAMAYGGNGITFSHIGADLLSAQLAGRRHPLSELFSFKRLEHRP